jgi:glucose-6-phosphate isomerase
MNIRNKTVPANEFAYPVVNMGIRLREMKEILSDFEHKDVVNRIWHKDHTVWKTNPAEISNRLGWLQVTDTMADKVAELEAFAREVQGAGFHHLVLLGMGGSSLGAEVLRRTFGNAAGYPPLVVLDSTHPAWIEAVAKSIEARHTLFLVSSKSGNTTETLLLYHYFQDVVRREIGEAKAGSNFVAITDYGTPLHRLAEKAGFRRIFRGSEDIGGRYSVLSYFGLVPAALAGINNKALIESAGRMQERCAPCVAIYENPGAWLGALIGSFALHGGNKLTFIISPSVNSFGLWVEQLLAESTGKEGKGVIPVIDEPLAQPKYYGDDRLFVYLRMKGDNNAKTDEAVMQLEVAGRPIVQLEMNDQTDLGAEFFRWEFATAVTGLVLGINPFNQPDVQTAKDATGAVLREFQSSPRFSRIQSCDSLKGWLEQARQDDYLAIMAYLRQTPATDRAFSGLRRKIMEKHRIATTLGYGPRFLHSTGQLHKGGPDSGLFLQITAGRRKDLKIPDEPYSFGVLTEAEARGDYQALEYKGKRVTRIQLRSASAAAIERLAQDNFLNL